MIDVELNPTKHKVWRAGNALVITIDSVLCQLYGIEEGDFIYTKIEKIEKQPEIKKESYGRKSKIIPGENVKIVLPEPRENGEMPTWRGFRLIPLYKKIRHFFPGYKIPFNVETDIGTIEIYATSARKGTHRGDPKGGYYLKGRGLTQWINTHDELEPGDKLIFSVIEPGKKYKLTIEK